MEDQDRSDSSSSSNHNNNNNHNNHNNNNNEDNNPMDDEDEGEAMDNEDHDDQEVEEEEEENLHSFILDESDFQSILRPSDGSSASSATSSPQPSSAFSMLRDILSRLKQRVKENKEGIPPKKKAISTPDVPFISRFLDPYQGIPLTSLPEELVLIILQFLVESPKEYCVSSKISKVYLFFPCQFSFPFTDFTNRSFLRSFCAGRIHMR